MIYITVMQSPRYHQMTLEDLLFRNPDNGFMISNNAGNTRTYAADRLNDRLRSETDVHDLTMCLMTFNNSVESLRKKDRRDLYDTFYIPKKSGGLRRIDAPKPELMNAMRMLKTILEENFHALYHTSAFAYVSGRCTVDAVKRHQANNSKWFGKYDLSNFFGSTTLEFVMQQFSMVYPFSQVMEYPAGRAELEKALELAFLDGVLPQGTPVSPTITNIMMIPVDYSLTKKLHNFNNQRFVNTRYADDFIISSKYTFDVKKVERVIVDTLNEFNAPFTINKSKTRYGSSAGSNWNLGVMLNKDNKITIGHQKKKQFQAMLHNYIMDKKNGIAWDKHDVQVLDGHYNYYRMVEKDAIDGIIRHMDEKMGTNVLRWIKADLK